MSELITLDFDVEKEAMGEVIADGSYKFQLSSAEPTVASTGNRMIKVASDIVDDPQFSGRRIYDNIVLTPAAAWKLAQFAKALGIDVKQPLAPAEWIGKMFYADVEGEEYEGVTRPKIAKYRASNA